MVEPGNIPLLPLEAAQADARLIVDLDALVANWHTLTARAAPAQCAAVVKANAYGTGFAPVAAALARAGCRIFFVAQAAEAIGLRAALADAPLTVAVYVFNGFDGYSPELYQRHHLKPVLSSMPEVHTWLAFTGPLGAALHIDTGMNRLGVSAAEARQVAAACTQSGKGLDMILSHFVASEVVADPLNDRQIDSFVRIRAAFPAIPASLANSSGIFLPSRPLFDIVRPGYALYGGNPTPGAPNPMRPVVQLLARIIQIRDADVGASVGYNAQWIAARPSRLATVNIGYADGFPRSAGTNPERGAAQASVNGTVCSIVGRVSMDLSVIDVTDVEPARAPVPGEYAELLGDTLAIDDLARSANRSGYEILTGLGTRYRRLYRGCH
jgi:alanine racemase